MSTLNLEGTLPIGTWRRRLALAALCFCFAALFLWVNRGAYDGYFSADDFDNLANARVAPAQMYGEFLLTLRYNPLNFRPIGHGVYFVMQRLAGLHFPAYIALIQILHLLNTLLLWLILRRFGMPILAASAGALFFAFELAVFDIYWKPMYVFDLVCCLFCLLAILAWMHDKVVLSLVAFWLAYKSKEVAVMLPAVLALYEYWFGARRWRRLILFFVVSLIFGSQALYSNLSRHDAYSLHFSLLAVAQSAWYYLSRLPGVPGAWLILLPLPFLVRDRRFWFGYATFFLWLVPMLLLRGKWGSAYLYIPLTGLAFSFATLAARVKPVWVALFFALWVPWNFYALGKYEDRTLAESDEVREWTSVVTQFVRAHPGVDTFIYDCLPASFEDWGVRGVLRYDLAPNAPLRLFSASDMEAEHPGAPAGVLRWDTVRHRTEAFLRAP